MKAPWWHYLLAFSLGWSGAVFSYSDLIYKKAEKATPRVSGSVEAPSTDISGNDGQSIHK